MTPNYEIYEDNGGGVYMVILDEDNSPIKIFENWELQNAGCLLDAFNQLKSDPEAWKFWEGDLMENLAASAPEETIEHIYENLGSMVAWSGEDGEMVISPHQTMGFNASFCLAIIDE